MPRRIVIIAVLLLVALPGRAWSQPAFHESFEDPEPSWKDAGGDLQYRLEGPQRVRGESHSGDWSEWLRVTGSNGSFVYVSHEVGRSRIIAELMGSVWIKSDRPGVQILARVVFPRTEDPRSGEPLSTLIHGTSYAQVGAWEQLTLTDLPALVSRAVRVLRAQVGHDVDAHEAYIDRVLLNVYGGQGQTNVWIDDLEMTGNVGPRVDTAVIPAAGAVPIARDGATPVARAEQSQAAKPPSVRFQGSLLLVEGRPFFPRIIQYQGEPLAKLQSIGFNAVYFSTTPPREVFEEAMQVGIWMICPPPVGMRDGASGMVPLSTPSAPSAEFGPEYDGVLAWDLGQNVARRELDATIALAKQVRAADRRMNRPLICGAEAELQNFSRHADVLMMYRMPLGSSLEVADYGTWLRERPRLAQPGTPIWTVVQTQPAPRLTAQWSALLGGEAPNAGVDPESIRQLARTALSAGTHGILFQSDSPLDADDPETRIRALALELANLELDLIEPWAAGGRVMGTADSTKMEVKGIVLQTDRARLMLPIRWEAHGQFIPHQTSATGLTFVVPGIPESHAIYELKPTGIRQVKHKRVTGGESFELSEFGLSSLIVMTQDPVVVDALTRRAAALGRRCAEAQRDLAAAELARVESIHRQLMSRGQAVPQAESWLATARTAVQQTDAALKVGDLDTAFIRGRAAAASLALLKRAHWDKAAAAFGSPIATPFTATFATLPQQLALMEAIRAATLRENLLPGGDFENVNADGLAQAGWRHVQYPQPEVKSDVELVPEAAYAGRMGLRLRARAADPKAHPGLIETPPVWVTTGAIPLAAGTLVCIRGRVRITAPINGSIDGLMIIDSYGGEALAERFGDTGGWKEFIMYRVATTSDPLTVTLALTGLGEAHVDDLSIRPVDRPGDRAEQAQRMQRAFDVPPPKLQ